MQSFLDAVDPSFPLDLDNSYVMAGLVAGKLASQGHEVKVLAKKIRPSSWQRTKYADKGDLVVDGKSVDVKWRRVVLRDLVTKYPTSVITPTHEWDRNPLYAIVQVDLQGDFMVIHGATRSLWTRDRPFDRYKGRRRENYYMEWRYLHIQPWSDRMVL